jgi:hypothetical protein
MSETSNADAEQLSWEQQLSSAVDRQVDMLVRSGVKPGKSRELSFGLVAPNGTRIRLTALPTLDHPRIYVPERTTLLDLGDEGVIPLVQGTKSMGRIYYSKYRDDFPLGFMIDTRAWNHANYSVSPSGEVSDSAIDHDAHYEAFAETYGTHVYKLGEDQRLHPVDPIEGERLLWLISNSVPSSGASPS